MATRKETAERRRALVAELRALVTERRLRPGEALPSTRTLAERHQISVPVVSEELRRLVDEGAVRAVPGVGMFAASLAPNPDRYVYIYPRRGASAEMRSQMDRLRHGFEIRSSELGADCLAIADEDLDGPGDAIVRSAAGVFAWPALSAAHEEQIHDAGVLAVRGAYAGRDADAAGAPGRADIVEFDDPGGGRLATSHLIGVGHERIAYLAAHCARSEPQARRWSRRRQEGWAQVMGEHGWPTDGFTAHPDRYYENRRVNAEQAAAAFIPLVPRISAVVGADDSMLLALVRAMTAARIPPETWPALVGFEATPRMSGYVLTSLRTPWMDAGKAAATLLWERRAGRLTGPAVRRSVPFNLVRGATSKPDWSAESEVRSLVSSP